MHLPYVLTKLVTEINFSQPTPISRAASFFHAYPRILNASTIFAADQSYRNGLYKLTIPYAATAIVLFLFVLIANFYFFFRKDVVPGADDTGESDPNARDHTARAFLVFSCFLNLAIIICIAVTSSGSYSLREVAVDAHDSIHKARIRIHYQLHDTVDTLQTLAEKIEQVKNSGRVFSQSMNDVYSMFKQNADVFDSVYSTTSTMLNNLQLIDDQFKYLSSSYFYFTMAVVFSLVVGIFCSFALDISTPDQKRLRIIAFSVLLIPLLGTWAHIALSTSISVACGDFCESVSEYHQYIHDVSEGKSPEQPTSNVFLDYQLGCGSVTQDQIRKLTIFLGNTNGLDSKFEDGLRAIVGSELAEGWDFARKWMEDRLHSFDNKCEMQRELGGRLSYSICGDHGLSGVSTMIRLWLCSCGMTLLFVVVVGLLTFGHPPMEYCTGRELLCIFGGAKLISAFGDVKDVMRRHISLRKMKEIHSMTTSSTSEGPSSGFVEGYDGALDHFMESRRSTFIVHEDDVDQSIWYSRGTRSFDRRDLGFS